MRASARSKSANPPVVTTIKEVAAAAGVSTATVSRVLAGVGGVADEARASVLAATAKLDYHPQKPPRAHLFRFGPRRLGCCNNTSRTPGWNRRSPKLCFGIIVAPR
jgi:hypothetical protein